MSEDRERGAGPRHLFVPVQRDGWVSYHPWSEELIAWCRVFHEAGLAPEAGGASLGNLSFRTPRGFVITPSRTRLKSDLQPGRLIEVVRVELLGGEDFRIHFLGGGDAPGDGGRVPSSDALLHHRIYCLRPDVSAVFHGHDPVMLEAGERLGIPLSVRELAFGTVLDAQETAESLGVASAMLRRNHGFITVGRTLDAAGQLALALRRRAAALLGRQQ